jgi:hypothetical protein
MVVRESLTVQAAKREKIVTGMAHWQKIKEVPETQGMLCTPTLLIRQEKSEIISHPFPQKTREWMGHTHSI